MPMRLDCHSGAVLLALPWMCSLRATEVILFNSNLLASTLDTLVVLKLFYLVHNYARSNFTKVFFTFSSMWLTCCVTDDVNLHSSPSDDTQSYVAY